MSVISVFGKTEYASSSTIGVAMFFGILATVFLFFLASSKNHNKTTRNRKHNTFVYRPRSINDVQEHQRIRRWEIKRAAFEEQKKTPFFKDWKREQYQCQYGKCAWCRKSIDLHSPDTQVDHIKPLMWWGTNEYDNLVLACKECNEEKGDSQFGWAGAKGMPGENRKPAWIRPNRCCRNFKEQNSQTVSYTTLNSDKP